MLKAAKAGGWLAAGLLMSGAAEAVLINRGGGRIYDDVLNVTWLRNADYSATQLTDAWRDSIIADVNSAQPSWLGTHTMNTLDFQKAGDAYTGEMNWWGAMAWAEQLVYGGSDDWRLPVVVDTGTPLCNSGTSGTDCGYNVQTADISTDPVTVYSEWAYMYYVNLGFTARLYPDGSPRSDFGIFGNGTHNGVDNSSFGQRDVGLVQNLWNTQYWTGTDYGAYDSAWRFSPITGGQGPQPKEAFNYVWALRTGDVPEPGTLILLGLGFAGLSAMRKRGRFRRS